MKILCIHATAGAGHQKAAEAVYDHLRQHTPHQAFCVDALDYTSPRFKKTYREGYGYLISRLPMVWAFVFAITDWPPLQPFLRWGRAIYNHLNARKLERFLIAERFDVIVSCHFLSTEVASRLKGEGKISSRLITVVTDFDVHRLWLGHHVDHFAAASAFTKTRLETLGISQDRVTVTGIPTHEKFTWPMDKHAIRRNLGLDPDAFTVLIATGSFGHGPIAEIVHRLKGLQVVVVCGHNKILFERLEAEQLPHVRVFGLVNNMHEMMGVADAMVTKPGGLSISEALVRHLPMIFFSAIPGQEQGNVRVLGIYGIGRMSTSIDHIVDTVLSWRDDPRALKDQCDRARQLACPDAAMDVAKLVARS